MKCSLRCMPVVIFLFLPVPPFSIPPYLYYFYATVAPCLWFAEGILSLNRIFYSVYNVGSKTNLN